MHLYNRTCVCVCIYPHMYLCIIYACAFMHLRIMYIGLYIYSMYVWHVLVEVLRYKPEGRGFNSRWCHWNFSL